MKSDWERQEEEDRRKQAAIDITKAWRPDDDTDAKKHLFKEHISVEEFVRRLRELPVASAAYDVRLLEAVTLEIVFSEPIPLTRMSKVYRQDN